MKTLTETYLDAEVISYLRRMVSCYRNSTELLHWASERKLQLQSRRIVDAETQTSIGRQVQFYFDFWTMHVNFLLPLPSTYCPIEHSLLSDPLPQQGTALKQLDRYGSAKDIDTVCAYGMTSCLESILFKERYKAYGVYLTKKTHPIFYFENPHRLFKTIEVVFTD